MFVPRFRISHFSFIILLFIIIPIFLLEFEIEHVSFCIIRSEIFQPSIYITLSRWKSVIVIKLTWFHFTRTLYWLIDSVFALVWYWSFLYDFVLLYVRERERERRKRFYLLQACPLRSDVGVVRVVDGGRERALRAIGCRIRQGAHFYFVIPYCVSNDKKIDERGCEWVDRCRCVYRFIVLSPNLFSLL